MHTLGESNNWISALAPELQKVVLDAGTTQKKRSGSEIYHVGEEAVDTYQLLSGEIGIYVYNNKDEELLLTKMYPGDCLGLMSMLDESERSNTAIATTDIELFKLSKSKFNELFDTHSEIARALCLLLSRRTRTLVSLVNEVTSLTLRQRIGRLLCRLGPYYGHLEGQTMFLEGVSHETLADVLGSSRQSIGREIRELEKEGLVELHYKKIRIPNFDDFQERFYSLLVEDDINALMHENQALL